MIFHAKSVWTQIMKMGERLTISFLRIVWLLTSTKLLATIKIISNQPICNKRKSLKKTLFLRHKTLWSVKITLQKSIFKIWRLYQLTLAKDKKSTQLKNKIVNQFLIIFKILKSALQKSKQLQYKSRKVQS